MDHQSEKINILIPATYRLLMVTMISFFIHCTLLFTYESPVPINNTEPTIVFSVYALLFFYFAYNPKKHVYKAITLYGVVTLLTTAPHTVFKTISAWQGHVDLLDVLPPFSGKVILSSILMLILLPEKLTKMVFIIWVTNAFPILLFLLTHPDQLLTHRGYDLLFFYVPASLLLLIIVPFQKSMNHHVNKMNDNLHHSQKEADRDFLTDIYNRRGLENWLAQNAKERSLCVLLVDIDKFKEINDEFGHSVGDNVLIEIASRLRAVYFGKHCLARWGGEEFIVVIADPSPHTTTLIAEKFRTTIYQQTYKAVGQLTASIGISTVAKANDFTTMVDQADKALYFAKSNGRNQTCLYHENLAKVPPMQE
ncbi:GGDEF domain-containing protein [Marinomonas sp. 5E14-1]|uniref:GGDEF domain-containing protein n=1 Tax=Marinomonas sp. 5E14-1 TaxID=3153922 RepID=UPI003263FD4A